MPLLNKTINQTDANGEIISEEIIPMEVTLIVTHHDKKDDTPEFDSFKFVDHDNKGKLIDCHFTRDVDTKKLAESGKKIKATFEKVTRNDNYEFVKVWCTGLKADSIKKII